MKNKKLDYSKKIKLQIPIPNIFFTFHNITSRMTEKPVQRMKIVIADKHFMYPKGLAIAFADKDDIAIIGEAVSGVQLLEMLKHVSPDVIIADLTQKEMNGFEILPQIKQSYPCIKVIIFTLFEHPEIINKAIEAGADSYLFKASSNASISVYEAIKQCYTNGFYLNDEIKETMLRVSKK